MALRSLPDDLNRIGTAILDCATEVHRELGPGLLESVYEACLVEEFAAAKLEFAQQVSLPIIYKGKRVPAPLRLDLLVENQVIVEVKAVEALTAVHEAQLLSYLKLSGRRLGYLLNFNGILLKHGIRRIVL